MEGAVGLECALPLDGDDNNAADNDGVDDDVYDDDNDDDDDESMWMERLVWNVRCHWIHS